MGEIRLRNNAVWMLIGNGSYAFMQWIQLSVLAKHSTPLELGVYTLALAITAPVFLFSGLQLRQLLVTDVKNEFHFSDYFTLRIFSVTLSLLVIILYSVLNNSNSIVLFLVAILKAIEGIAEIFNARQQYNERMKNVAVSLILRGLSTTVFMTIGIFIYESLAIGLTFAVLSNILILYFNDYRNYRKSSPSKNIFSLKKARIEALIIKGLPLGGVMLLLSLNTNIPKYVIEYFRGTELQGVYSTLSYCLVLCLFVTTALGQSFMPRLSRYYMHRNNIEFRQLCIKFIFTILSFASLLFIITLFAGKSILFLLFSAEIANYQHLFAMIMLSGIIACLSSSLGYILSSMRIFKIQPYISGITLVVNIICCYILLNKFDLHGIVYASMISFSVQALISAWIIFRNRIPQSNYNMQQ